MDGIIADRIAAFRRMRLEPTKVVTAIAPEQSIRKQTLMKTTVPGYTVAGPILTPIEKQFQAMVIARDWNSLVRTPLGLTRRNGQGFWLANCSSNCGRSKNRRSKSEQGIKVSVAAQSAAFISTE